MADDRVCEGYHVIKSKRIKDVEIVLAHNPKAPSPYVTWKSESCGTAARLRPAAQAPQAARP